MSSNQLPTGYFQRLRRFWFPERACWAWTLAGLPALYFFQTAIHEGTHAVTTLVGTGQVVKFAPFPHMTLDGRFLNGVTLGSVGLTAVPQFVALALVVLLSLVCTLWPVSSVAGRFALRLWYLGASVDLLYNTARELVGGHSRFADWSRFQDRLAIPDGWMIALTWMIWLIVLSHFGWVHLSAWQRRQPDSDGPRPYRWVALTLSLVSFSAVVVSLSVRDPRIVKDHIAFVLPVIVQALVSLGCGVYFVYSTARSTRSLAGRHQVSL